jgi:hypothetical protein
MRTLQFRSHHGKCRFRGGHVIFKSSSFSNSRVRKAFSATLAAYVPMWGKRWPWPSKRHVLERIPQRPSQKFMAPHGRNSNQAGARGSEQHRKLSNHPDLICQSKNPSPILKRIKIQNATRVEAHMEGYRRSGNALVAALSLSGHSNDQPHLRHKSKRAN